MNIYEIKLTIYDVQFNILGDELTAVVIAENDTDALGQINLLPPYESVDSVRAIGICADVPAESRVVCQEELCEGL